MLKNNCQLKYVFTDKWIPENPKTGIGMEHPEQVGNYRVW